MQKRCWSFWGDEAFPDNTWGIDHALWTTLSNMYPEADIPVVVISTNMEATPLKMVEIGRKLSPLRYEGALLFGTGNVVHNVDMVDHSMKGGLPWAVSFDRKIKELVIKRDIAAIADYNSLKDHELAVPTLDHYYPLLFAPKAMGALKNRTLDQIVPIRGVGFEDLLKMFEEKGYKIIGKEKAES